MLWTTSCVAGYRIPVLGDVEHSRLEWYAPGRTGTLLLPRGSLYSSHPVFNIGGQGGLDAVLLFVVAVIADRAAEP